MAAGCSCKVGRVAETWGFETVHEDLETRWVEEGVSLRDLAASFNRRLLRAAFEEADRTPIEGEIENLYRVLTGEDVDAGSRTQARERLRSHGIDVAEVETQFVSHQTIYRHLRDCLSVTPDDETRTAGERIDTWRDRIRALKNRTAAVTTRGVEQLDGDALEVGAVDVFVDVTVTCTDCGEIYELEELLDSGGCGCAESATNG